MKTLGKTLFAVAAATSMISAFAGAANAETMQTEGPIPLDPVMEWADQLLPRNEFVLNSEQNIELVRYNKVHDIDVCIAKPDPGAVFGTSTAVPVTVSWDNDVGTVFPGNCLSFEAKSVKVQPAAPLPNDTQLEGTFKVIH